MIDSSRPDEPPFLNPDLQFRQPVQPVDRSIYQTSVLAFRGLVLGTVCVFPFRLLSDEAQRAGLARESSRAPSTPGGLGYLVAERLMDLNSVCSSSFLGFVLRWQFFFIVSSDLRTKVGTSPKVPSNFYNLKNISRAGLVSGRSLIDKLRFIVASDVILRSIFPLLWRSPLPSVRKARRPGRLSERS